MMASRAEDLPWPTAQPRLPSMDEMDYVMHSTIPEPPPPRLQHPPITGVGTCPYSVAHRVDHHGSPLPSPNYNSVSSLLSPVRNTLHPSPPSHTHSQPPHLLSQQQQQQNHLAHTHTHAHHHHHHHSQHTSPQQHSHSHSQSHPHHPYDPVHPPAPTNHWFSHHPPPAPQPPHWGHQFAAPDARSSSSGLFSPQLPSLFPPDQHHNHHHHHHQYMSANHHTNNNNNNGGGGSANSSSTNLHSSSGSSGGSGLGLGPGINPLLVPHHSVSQSLDPFASSWSLYRQHPHRLPESAQRFNPGPHAHLGNSQQHPAPTNASSAPAISPRSLPNPTMPERHGQSPAHNSQQSDSGSFSHSSSASPSSSARASPNPADGALTAHAPLDTPTRPRYGQQGPQTPTRSEVSLGAQPRSNMSPQGPTILRSYSGFPPVLLPAGDGGMDEPAARSGSGGHISGSDSEPRRSTPSHRRSAAVEVHVSDDESDSSEEHMEEMFIHQLGAAAGPPYTARMDLTEDRIRRQQLLRGAITNKRIASRGALASLQSVDIDSLQENERTCVICYNEFGVPNPEGINEAPLRLPKCKHVFGDHCIKKWFEESDSCPYCRDKVPSEPAMRLNPRSVNIFAGALPDGRPALMSGNGTGTAALVSDAGFLYRAAHANPYGAAGGASRAAWQAARRSPPEDIDARSRRTRPRHGSLRGAPSTGSSNGGSARPNSFAGASSSTPSSQQVSPGRDRYYSGSTMGGPVHWQLHAHMEGRRMQGQPLRQQPMPMPPVIPRGLMNFPMQHRPGQPSGTAAYSPSPLTPDSFPGMMNMGQANMPPSGPDAGYMNPLGPSGPSDTTSSLGPVPPVEAGAPFPGPGSSTPLFSQHLPPVGGLDDNPFERPGPAPTNAVNWSQN
ncbi:hypothetical protein RB595_000488 [Gaeumannomyces hyphopodioides]